jgi:hypothetical protein
VPGRERDDQIALNDRQRGCQHDQAAVRLASARLPRMRDGERKQITPERRKSRSAMKPVR